MATLHLVNKPAGLHACLTCLQSGDCVLLIEDGVYVAVQDHGIPLLALEEDATARAVSDRLSEHCKLVSEAEFVELVVSHQPIITWR